MATRPRSGERFIEGFELPEAADIADAIAFAIAAPVAVNIGHMEITPTLQVPGGLNGSARGQSRPTSDGGLAAMKGFDLTAILLNPDFGRMLLHGLEMTFVIALGSWLLAMSSRHPAAVDSALLRAASLIARSRPTSPTTATCRRWCS